jgi:hypothetical protein
MRWFEPAGSIAVSFIGEPQAGIAALDFVYRASVFALLLQ